MSTPLHIIQKKREKLMEFTSNSGEIPNSINLKLKLEFVFFLNTLNTSELSKAETFQIIEKQLAVGGKKLAAQHQAHSYAQIAEWLLQSTGSSRGDVTEQLIIDLHTIRFIQEENDSSMLRYTYKVPYALTEYIEWLQQKNGDPVEVAIEAGVRLLKARFLDDPSYRTVFLVINLLLIQGGYPLIFIADELVNEYLEEVRSIESGGTEARFIEMMYEAVRASLNLSLEMIGGSDSKSGVKLLKIGELAKSTGETVPTIRHWTKMGLLRVVDTTPGGYQLYDPHMAEVVLKIRFLQNEKRLQIAEIREQMGQTSVYSFFTTRGMWSTS